MFTKNILFDYNWDVDKYKSNYDPEYWDLCRTFMEVHKTKYPEQKLAHLTEAFYQIGVYGSCYDAKTTRMVSALSVEVLDDYLETHPGTVRHPFKSTPVALSEVIDITSDASPNEDKRKSPKAQSNSIWDKPIDTSIIVNVLESQQLENLFRNFVIIYDVKLSSELNDDKVTILEDSFRRSKFGPLHWDKNDTHNNICPTRLALKWKSTVLAEAVGSDENALRVRLAQAILSKMSEFCQGIEAKWIYYRDGKVPECFHRPNPKRNNVYKFLPHSQFKDAVEITSYIDTFANSDSFTEIVFGLDFNSQEKSLIIEHVKKAWGTKLTYRTLSKNSVKSKVQTYVCVYHIHTGDDLRRWIMGFNGDNERYRIVAPKDHRRAGKCDSNVREMLKTVADASIRKEPQNSVSLENMRKEVQKRQAEATRKLSEIKRKDEEMKKRKEEEEKKRKEEAKKREDKKRKEEEEKKRKDQEKKKKEEEEKEANIEDAKKIIQDSALENIKLQNKTSDEISGENLEKLLDGFVLFYDAKKNSEIDKDDWFSALLESFKMSTFGPLEVLNENLRPMRMRCVFKWRNNILASAEGLTETQAKTAATLQLISKLEPFTYIIQAKEEYFFDGKVPPFIENPDPTKSNVYRIVRRQDLPSYYAIFQTIDDFVKTKSYGEIVFGNDFTWELKNEIVVYIKAKGLDYRYFTSGDQKPWTHMAIYHTVAPEDLKHYLLSHGGENEKYKLIPPPKAEPIIVNKSAEVEVVKEKTVTTPLSSEKVAKKRKEPEKEPSAEESEGNKIQINLKKFKLDKVDFPEDTGGDFPGLILWVNVKKNSTMQKSMFCILLDSFKMSKFGNLFVEEDQEAVWGKKEPLKKCVIKANRKVLGVGFGESKGEAKNSASLQILRKLRKHCYTIQAKESYFKEGKATPFDFEPDPGKENVYRVVKRNKFKDRTSIINFVDVFARNRCSHELIFGDDFSNEEREAILTHCRQIKLNYRLMKCQSTCKFMHTHVAIYHEIPLPVLKTTLVNAGGENDMYRLIPPGGKISAQNSQSDLWPETLEDNSEQTSSKPQVTPTTGTVTSKSGSGQLSSEPSSTINYEQEKPTKNSNPTLNLPNKHDSILPTVLITDQDSKKKNLPKTGYRDQILITSQENIPNQHLHSTSLGLQPMNSQQFYEGHSQDVPYGPQPQFIPPIPVYGQQTHPDMPLTFGPQPQLVVFAPQQNSLAVLPETLQIQVDPARVLMEQSVAIGEPKVNISLNSSLSEKRIVHKQIDLREELSKKHKGDNPKKKTPERKSYDLSQERKIRIQDSKDQHAWTRQVFVNESGSGKGKKSKSPDLQQKLRRKDLPRERLHRRSQERNKRRSSLDRHKKNLRNSREKSPMHDRHRMLSDRNRPRDLSREKYRSSAWETETKIVKEEQGSSYERTRDVYSPTNQREHQRSHTHRDGRMYDRPRSSVIRFRDLWDNISEEISMQMFMYKYVKQDSKTEKDPICLLQATRSHKFNVDFDFIKQQVAIDEWQVFVELVTDHSNVRPLVGEGVGVTLDEAKLIAANHAVDTIQKACRVIEPNYHYFADGGEPDFIIRRSPMKTNVYEIIQNLDPDNPLDRYTIDIMFSAFLSSELQDLFFLATDFSYLERMLVVEVANQKNLWWRLFGPRHKDDRPNEGVSTQHVCVFKQKSAIQLYQELLENNGSTEKYLLINPYENRITQSNKRHI